jgi:hypothetical protein
VQVVASQRRSRIVASRKSEALGKIRTKLDPFGAMSRTGRRAVRYANDPDGPSPAISSAQPPATAESTLRP